MTIALNLTNAAGLAFDNLQVKWLSNHLKDSLQNFWIPLLPLFPDINDAQRPVSNWLIIIATFSDLISQTSVPISDLTLAAEYVYRMCWMTDVLRASGAITSAQATAVLGAYNGNIGV